jgi:hypothetical protein
MRRNAHEIAAFSWPIRASLASALRRVAVAAHLAEP